MTKRFIAFILSLVFITNNSFCQNNEFQKFSAEELQQDLELLSQSILETHQNPFTYCSNNEYQEAYQWAKKNLSDSLNAYEFAKIIATFLGTLRDSHTYLNYASLRKKYQKEKGKILNFEITSINDSLYFSNRINDTIQAGDRLVSFNGIPAQELINKVSKYSIYEGKSYRANQRIAEAIFANTLGYITPILDTNFLVIDHGNNTLTTEKLIATQLETHREKGKTKSKFVPYELQIVADEHGDIAILRIASFSAKSNQKFYRFLKKSFKTIRKEKINSLAIDLRDNLGGQIVRPNMLLGFLTPNSAYIPQNIIAKQSEVSKKMYRKKINAFFLFFVQIYPFKSESLKNFVRQVKMKKGETDTLYYKELNPFFSKKNEFQGQSYLMINGMSGSASVLFASAFRNEINQGLIFGEPCLGPASGTWGNPAPWRLPHSGLEVYISTIRTNIDNSFTTDPMALQPDIWVYPTKENLKKMEDPYLITLKKTIENNTQEKKKDDD